ncbi:MAG TPA: PQQ-dependent sugar dehydrogenase [Anaerolineales bacterium]|nr:PQQ-dependent sugar dehydrogenase [Anaerolineales bacterium]
MKTIQNFAFLASLLLISACQTLPVETPAISPTTLAETVVPPNTPAPSPTPNFTPTVPAAVIELQGTTLPSGFSILKFAEIYRPTALTVDLNGNILVASADSNIYIVSDADKDGHADTQSIFASGYYIPLGLTVHPATGDVYVSYQGAIAVLTDSDKNGEADSSRILVEGLPSTGRHQNNNLEFGPDGWLYMGMGSTCDACAEADARNATIMRFNLETGEKEIFASGLRNPFDIAFHPLTGELFSTDNGRDDLGLDMPNEELNLILQNGNYGFPNCWNEQNTNGCENTIPAVAFFEPHSSADGLDFYKGNQFPIEYQNNAFVGIFGSWLNPALETGIKRVILTPKDGTYTSEVSWFAKFPKGVMPLPLQFGPDGALYVGDYINDVVYRISYRVP